MQLKGQLTKEKIIEVYTAGHFILVEKKGAHTDLSCTHLVFIVGWANEIKASLLETDADANTNSI